MPEYGKYDQSDKQISGDIVIADRIPVSEKRVDAVDFKSAEGQKEDQNGLHPMPESFKRFIYIDFFTTHYKLLRLTLPGKNWPQIPQS